MAAFDVDGYRKAAKAAGISDSEIENEIKFQTSAPAKTDPFEKDEGGFKLSSVEQVNERLGNDWWHLPAGLAAVGLGIYGASKLMGGGPDDPDDPNNKPKYRFDPTFDVEPLPSTQQVGQQSLPQQTNLIAQDIQARAAQLKAATPGIPDVPPQFSPGPVSPAGNIPPAPPYQPSTPFSAAPPGAPAPEPSSGPNSSTTSIVNNTVKEMIDEVDNSPPEMRTGATSQAAPETAKKSVPPVYPKAGKAFKTEADIPPGFVARYDVGNLDRSMGNILGLEHRANARDLFNQGKPFGQSANLNQDVSDLTKRYFQQLQSEIPETLLGREARQAQKIPSEFGVFSKNTPFGTGVTIAGKAATLFALPHIANAAQQGNYGSAALQAADIATDYLPFVGQVKQALSPSSAGEGSTLSPQIVAQQKAYMDNLYRLGGGPLANTEAGERFRRNEEMTRRIAGRTGAAVPPQYRR